MDSIKKGGACTTAAMVPAGNSDACAMCEEDDLYDEEMVEEDEDDDAMNGKKVEDALASIRSTFSTHGDVDGKQCTETNDAVPDGILDDIAKAIGKNDDVGKKIDEKLAGVCTLLATTAANDATIADTMDKYAPPANCSGMGLTRVNEVIWNLLSANTRRETFVSRHFRPNHRHFLSLLPERWTL